MKRIFSLILAAAMLLCAAPALAGDGLILNATVEGRETLVLKAPASGELAAFSVRTGDELSAGDTVFEVEPVRVYADITGTVGIVHVRPGDIADAAVARYGAVVQIDYADRYILQANARTGYNNADNRDMYVGTPVYLRSSNEKHFADGVITAVDGLNFVVQVMGGDLVYTQEVKVYREEDYASNSLLARGNLSTIAPRGYTASGTIVEMGVQAGDEVQPGDFLFSYVPDQLDPVRRGQADATCVKAEENLIVTAVSVQQGASVQKGQTLLSAIRAGDYELTAQAEEGDLAQLTVGDVLSVCFEEADAASTEAVITSISPLGTDAGDVSTYTVRLSFTAPEGVYPGMHATLEK